MCVFRCNLQTVRVLLLLIKLARDWCPEGNLSWNYESKLEFNSLGRTSKDSSEYNCCHLTNGSSMMTISFQIASLSSLKDDCCFTAKLYLTSICHLGKWLSNTECIMAKYPKIPYHILSRNGFKSKCYIILNGY